MSETQNIKRTPKNSILSTTGHALVKLVIYFLIFAALIATLHHYFPSPGDELKPPGPNWYSTHMQDYKSHPISRNIHVLLGVPFLLIGYLQFAPKFRRKSWARHRAMGFSYVVLGTIISLSSIYISVVYPFSGFLQSILGFISGGFFLVCLGMGIAKARQKKLNEHRHWMIRSYATVLGAVALNRVIMNMPFNHGLSYEDWFLVTWLAGLVIALTCVELWIMRTRNQRN